MIGPKRLKLIHVLARQFGADLLEPPDCLGSLQTFATPQTNLGTDRDHRGVHAPTQKLLYLLLYHLAATHRALLERHHVSLLIRQSIQRSGSGRSTVTRTAHALFSLYAQTECTGSPSNVSP
jgi:hypothetical protein